MSEIACFACFDCVKRPFWMAPFHDELSNRETFYSHIR